MLKTVHSGPVSGHSWLTTDLSVEINFPGPGVGIVLLLLLAPREHAADQALGAGHS